MDHAAVTAVSCMSTTGHPGSAYQHPLFCALCQHPVCPNSKLLRHCPFVHATSKCTARKGGVEPIPSSHLGLVLSRTEGTLRRSSVATYGQPLITTRGSNAVVKKGQSSCVHMYMYMTTSHQLNKYVANHSGRCPLLLNCTQFLCWCTSDPGSPP